MLPSRTNYTELNNSQASFLKLYLNTNPSNVGHALHFPTLYHPTPFHLDFFPFSSRLRFAEKWKKFFSDAGIPSADASTYAFKFAQNRIQTNMLTDLNKDYLKEMGITIMGDVIAILRHSKQVYEEVRNSLLPVHFSKSFSSPNIFVYRFRKAEKSTSPWTRRNREKKRKPYRKLKNRQVRIRLRNLSSVFRNIHPSLSLQSTRKPRDRNPNPRPRLPSLIRP